MKGDGRYFNIPWLKRRVKRFLIGVNGSSPHIDNTDDISISFGPNYGCTIRFPLTDRTPVMGALLNRFGCNGTRGGIAGGASSWPDHQIVTLNSLFTTATNYPRSDYINQFAEAIDAGV